MGTTVSGTYGRLVQVVGGLYYDGNGNLLNLGGGTTSIGPQGPTGSDGLQGPQGPTGSDGLQGPQGPTGADGLQGVQGPTGSDGLQGPQGPTGSDGPQGPTGSDGFQGATGATGLPGAQGATGANGTKIIGIERDDLLPVTFNGELVNNVLEIGVIYRIEGCDVNLYETNISKEGGTIIFLQALSENQLSDVGTGIFCTPKYEDTSIFDYNSISNYLSGSRVIWGGYVWEAKGFTYNNSIDLFNLDTSEWTKIIPEFGDSFYNISYDEVKYDIVNDRIIYRNEQNVNIVSTNYANILLWENERSLYNPIKSFQWGRKNSEGTLDKIYNQHITNSYNENINMIGSQFNIIFNNLSYQRLITNYGYQSDFIFDNGSYQTNVSIDVSSFQKKLTFNDGNQDNLYLSGGSHQDGLKMNMSSQTNFSDSLYYQRNITFNNYTFDRGSGEFNNYEDGLFYTGNLPADNSAPYLIGKINNQLVEVDITSISGGGVPGETGATGPAGETGATGPAGETGATGSQGVQGNNGISGGQVWYLNYSVGSTSSVSTYKQFSIIPTTTGQTSQTISNVLVGATATFTPYISNTNSPGITIIQPGIWTFYLHFQASNNSNWTSSVEVYKYNVSETLLFTTAPVDHSSGTVAAMIITDTFYTGTTLLSTDRLIVKVYSKNNDVQTNSITLLTEGSDQYSFATTPLGIITGSLDELQDVVITSAANSDILAYELSTGLWKNKTIVGDTIVDGVTTVAPSQNAVFDALALKGNLIIQVTPVTLLVSGWTLVSGFYEYNYANASILSTSIVDVIPSNSTIAIVQAAAFLPSTLSASGTVKLYTNNLPTADIIVTFNIFN